MKIFSIPINIRISSNDTWEAIKCKIINVINQENFYNYIYRKLKSIYSVSSSLVSMLQQLDQIKDNYYAKLTDSFNLIGEQISFYLESDDVEIVKSTVHGFTSIQFVSLHNDFLIDFRITTLALHDSNMNLLANQRVQSF